MIKTTSVLLAFSALLTTAVQATEVKFPATVDIELNDFEALECEDSSPYTFHKWEKRSNPQEDRTDEFVVSVQTEDAREFYSLTEFKVTFLDENTPIVKMQLEKSVGDTPADIIKIKSNVATKETTITDLPAGGGSLSNKVKCKVTGWIKF